MRILIYGAGNIGCLYAGRLSQRAEVEILARGARADSLRREGLVLEEASSGSRTSVRAAVVETLGDEATYDLVIVALPKQHLGDALAALARHPGSPSVLLFGNNAAGPGALVESLGRSRVLLGFPGAAAVRTDGALRYLITSRREQPTTIGELDEAKSERVGRVIAVLESAGFPSAHCPRMDAWLKTHVAKVLPTTWALMAAGGDTQRLVADNELMRALVRAIRDGFRTLQVQNIPITPSNHRVLDWLPQGLLRFAMKKLLGSPSAAIKMGHALAGRAEWDLLADEFQQLIDSAARPTPGWDFLRRRAAKPIPQAAPGDSPPEAPGHVAPAGS